MLDATRAMRWDFCLAGKRIFEPRLVETYVAGRSLAKFLPRCRTGMVVFVVGMRPPKRGGSKGKEPQS